MARPASFSRTWRASGACNVKPCNCLQARASWHVHTAVFQRLHSHCTVSRVVKRHRWYANGARGICTEWLNSCTFPSQLLHSLAPKPTSRFMVALLVTLISRTERRPGQHCKRHVHCKLGQIGACMVCAGRGSAAKGTCKHCKPGHIDIRGGSTAKGACKHCKPAQIKRMSGQHCERDVHVSQACCLGMLHPLRR